MAWDASPIRRRGCPWRSGRQIKDSTGRWSSSPATSAAGRNRLWPMEKHYHWLGGSGGYRRRLRRAGFGRRRARPTAICGRFSVSIQSDGDLMYAPGVLWTAARHKIPLLAVMHNNRGYHQEVMHVQRLANFRNRVAKPATTCADRHQHHESGHRVSQAREIDGLVGEGADQGSGRARSGDQGGGRGRSSPASRRWSTCGRSRANPRGMSIMRHQMLRVALAALAAGMVLGHSAALAASAEKGKAAYMKYGCWQCHGTQGQGSVATSNGKLLAPNPLPL